MKAKDILKYGLSSALAVFLLWFSFKDVNWTDFLMGLKACRWEFVVLSMLIGVASFFFRSLRWKMMLDPLDASLRLGPVINATNISYLLNLVLPRGGDVIRCAYITKHSETGPDGRKKASFDKVLGTSLMDRVWDALFMVLIFVCMIAVMWNRYGGFVRDNIFGSVASRRNTVIVIVSVVVVMAAAVLVVQRFKDRNRFAGRIWRFCKGLWEGLFTCLHMEKAWKFLIYTVLVWLCYWFMCVAIIWSVQGVDPGILGPDFADGISRLHDLDLMDGLFLCLIGSLSTLIPVPGGFGAYHYLVSMSLSVIYGVPMEIGIIFATLAHESQTVTQILCGGVSYILEIKS